MKKIKKILQSFSFDEAKFLVRQNFVTSIERKSSEVSSFSNSIKLFCIYLFCFFISLLPMENSIEVTVFLDFLYTVCYLMYFKIKSDKEYLKNLSYSMSLYLMSQTTIMSIFLGIREDNHSILGSYYTLFALIYIVLTVLISFKRCEYIILDYLAKKGVEVNLGRVTRIWHRVNFKLTAGVLLLIILGTQLFRLNKWWLNDNSSPIGTISITNEWLGSLFIICLLFIVIILIVSITMIPTLLFNVGVITDGIIVNMYPEAFRKEYDVTKEEWYGE